MNKINWKVRLQRKSFWLAVIPTLALVGKSIAAVFGLTYDFSDLVDKLLVVVNAVFALLILIGIVNDPTTSGLADSKQALTYDKPKKDSE